MPRRMLVAAILALAALVTASCTAEGQQQAARLVGFGPLFRGTPAGYCHADSPILTWGQTERILEREIPRNLCEGLDKLETEEQMAAFVNRVFNRLAIAAQLMIDPSLTEAGISYHPPARLGPAATIGTLLRACYGDGAGFQLKGKFLLVAACGHLREELPVAYYPVADLCAARPRSRTGAFASEEVSPYSGLMELIQRTVRADEPWESAGGRAVLDFEPGRRFLVVQQTPRGHMELARFLVSLRVMRARSAVR